MQGRHTGYSQQCPLSTPCGASFGTAHGTETRCSFDSFIDSFAVSQCNAQVCVNGCRGLHAGPHATADRVEHLRVQCLLQVVCCMMTPCSAPSANGKMQCGWHLQEALLWNIHPQKEKAASQPMAQNQRVLPSLLWLVP